MFNDALLYRVGLVKPPPWYPLWVKDYPTLTMKDARPSRISATLELNFLLQVKTDVDRAGLYRPDLCGDRCTGFQPVPDGFDKGKPAGDSEDFAFEYMKLLLNGGVPRGAVRFAKCRTGVTWHSVLAVVTDRPAPLILDYRFRERLWYKNYGPMLLSDRWAWESIGNLYWWEPIPNDCRK